MPTIVNRKRSFYNDSMNDLSVEQLDRLEAIYEKPTVRKEEWIGSTGWMTEMLSLSSADNAIFAAALHNAAPQLLTMARNWLRSKELLGPMKSWSEEYWLWQIMKNQPDVLKVRAAIREWVQALEEITDADPVQHPSDRSGNYPEV
jgi:hypothetical protein